MSKVTEMPSYRITLEYKIASTEHEVNYEVMREKVTRWQGMKPEDVLKEMNDGKLSLTWTVISDSSPGGDRLYERECEDEIEQ